MKSSFSKTIFLCLLFMPLLVLADKKDKASTFTLPSGIRVKIVEAPFSESLFKVELCKKNEGRVCLIDGKSPHGSAGSIPLTYLKDLTVSYKNKSYILDTSNMFNAWGNRPLEFSGSIRYLGGFCYDEETCVVRGLFSDAGGSFAAEWAITGGISQRTVISESNDIINLFMKHIDPPKFE